jgi:serine/threonine protein kinase
MAGRLMAEGALLAEMISPSPFVPLPLTQWHDDAYLYNLLKPRIVGDLQQFMDAQGPLDELSAAYYAASLALAIRHLHEMHVACRHLSPEAVALDAAGGVQVRQEHKIPNTDTHPASLGTTPPTLTLCSPSRVPAKPAPTRFLLQGTRNSQSFHSHRHN